MKQKWTEKLRLFRSKKGTLVILLILLLLFTRFLKAAPSDEQGSYFPTNIGTSNNAAERLAIVSLGPNLPYTAGIYEISIPKNPGYVDFSIWDAPTHEEVSGLENADVDYDLSKQQFPMDLLFKNVTKVMCVGKDGALNLTITENRLNVQSQLCDKEEIFKRNKPGQEDSLGWSLPLRLYGTFVGTQQTVRASVQTLWKEHQPQDLKTKKDVPNTINVFAFRSKNGPINLKPTVITKAATDLKVNNQPISYDTFRKITSKQDYEISVNWIFPYGIKGVGHEPQFYWDLDVSGLKKPWDDPIIDDLILFDKESDAAKLYPASKPPDQGISMSVEWVYSDGTFEKLNDWSIFDQTPRSPSKTLDPTYQDGDQNSYQGPSGDNSTYPSDKYIHWYRFPMEQMKSRLIRVRWYGFKTYSNAFGFAANVPVYAAEECKPPNCPPPGNRLFFSTINAIPESGTEDLKPKGITQIIYTVIIENTSGRVIKNVEVEFNRPSNTTLTESTLSKLIKDAKIMPLGDFAKDEKRNIELSVNINSNAKNDATITTQNKLFAQAEGVKEKLVAVHYLGKKGVLPAENGDQNEGQNPNNPNNPNNPENPGQTVTVGILEASITSIPLPYPAAESTGLKRGDTITYLITIKNISDTTPLTKVNLAFEPPANTTLSTSLIPTAIPIEGSGAYTGKGKGRFDLVDSLAPLSSIKKEVPIVIDGSAPLNFDIVTGKSFVAGAEYNDKAILPSLMHKAGKGNISISLERCYAYNFQGGEFKCNTTCDAQEPGTLITVQDTLKNKGSTSAFDHVYYPFGLSSRFEYVGNSIRIDDPTLNLTVPNDGSTFPPSTGIQVPGAILPQDSRKVYFIYRIPEKILDPKPNEQQCFLDQPEISPNPDERGYSDYNNTTCSTLPPQVCVIAKPGPELEVTLSATPSVTSKVYQNSPISYQLRIVNKTRQPVKTLQINTVTINQTSCKLGDCSGKTVSSPTELAGGDVQIPFIMWYTVQVNSNAKGSNIVNPGHQISYAGENGKTVTINSNNLTHTLIASPEPTGEFRHDMTLNRHLVLNAEKEEKKRGDGGDLSEISHTFTYNGTQKRIPSDLSGGNDYSEQICWYSYPSWKYYDERPDTQVVVYNSTDRSTASNFYATGYENAQNIKSSSVSFPITTTLEENKRPDLVFLSSGAHQYTFSYQMVGDQVNSSLKNGFTISKDQLEKPNIRGVKDGQLGKIQTENKASTNQGQGEVIEDQWQFVHVRTNSYYNGCTASCDGWGRCSYYTRYEKVYEWKITSSRPIPMRATDTDSITVLTSVAWLKTQSGHLGFGEAFWNQLPNIGDPNAVPLDDKTVSVDMKFYTPQNESQADLFVYSPDGSDPLKSSLGSTGKINIQTEASGKAQGFSSGKLSRGEIYDREKNPRNYWDDLIIRQVFGKVLHSDKDPLPSGISPGFTLLGTGVFLTDTIYHLKGTLTIGDGGKSDVILDGGKARIVVEGDAIIKNNIRYSKKTGDLSQIPSIRLHTTGNIIIDPAVTDIELMMLSEKEFHSGKGDKQLRILGDVIAYKVSWERTPLNDERKSGDIINNPSEIIFEDLRKYLLTPPGDKKLPDTGGVWTEVLPGTGLPILNQLFE